jgi:photosystem II stability/assembly factor-like uncharacterized protein
VLGAFSAAVLLSSPAPQGVAQSVRPVTPRRLDAFRIIGPGGGGAFLSVAISPHDPNLVFTASDMTDSFVTENGGKTWREFNLRTMPRFTFDPTLPNRVWAVTTASGAFYSDDRGRTWRMFYPDVSSIANFWYVADEGEPYYTTPAGDSPVMNAFAVDPENPDTVYAVWSETLWMTRDLGKHWSSLHQSVPGRKLFVDPASPRDRRIVYVVTSNSVDVWDGAEYARHPPASASTSDFPDTSIGCSGSGRKPVIYAVQPDHGGIVATRDGGETWASVVLPLRDVIQEGTFPAFRAVATSLQNPEVVYASYSELKLRGDSNVYFGVARSDDGGKHWLLARKDSAGGAPNIEDAWIGQRFGPDWGEHPLTIAVDDHNPSLVYTGDMGRVLRSLDGGAHWQALYSRTEDGGYTTTGLDPTTVYGVHFDPFDARRMFISYTDIGLFRSENAGRSWVSSTAKGAPHAWQNTTYWVEFDPAVRGRMWAVMSRTHDLPRARMVRRSLVTARGGVLSSSDGGRSWIPSSGGLPEMAATHILLDPRSSPEARVLYVCGVGRGVFRSQDGGKTWAPKNRGLPAVEPLTWRMAMDRNGVLYVVTVRRSENGTYGGDADGWLFRSRDGAESWEKIALPEGLNGPVAITVDRDDPSRLYLSAWGRFSGMQMSLAEQGGVFLSTDGGHRWNNVLNASRRIYDVTIDPQDHNVLYATGFEASAWRSADRGNTWSRIRGFNFKHGHRIIPDPLDRSKIYIATFGSSVWHGPAEGDPQAVEDIVAPPIATFDAPGGASPGASRR